MKSFVFSRENNDFSDILTDANIKKHVCATITFTNYLILGIQEDKELDKVSSYILLKYGEEIIDFKNIVGDRTPIPYVDYRPKKKLVDGHYIDN
jgi:hypothetical protein